MPGVLDLALVVLFGVVWPVYSTLWDWPRYLVRLRAGVPGARVKQYLSTMVEQWVLSAMAVVLWIRGGRPWAALGLSSPTGWRAWAALATIVAIIIVFAMQLSAV